MMKRPFSIPSHQWVVALLFAVLTIAALYLFVRFAEPDERKPSVRFAENYSEEPLLNALTAAGLQARVDAIKAAGQAAGGRQVGRYSGSAGCAATADLIRQAYKDAGLEVVEQEFPVVVPVTEYCEALGADGAPLNGIELFPFEPSGLLPTVCKPEQFADAKIVVIESSQPLDLVGKEIDGNIVVNRGMDCNWPALAALGAKAVIVVSDPAVALAPDKPDNWADLVTPFDTSFPRFYARGPIEQFAGQPVRLNCKVTWQQKPVQNLLGVLRSEQPTRDALVINCFYDSYSVVPELAPGGEQALSLAAMLELLKALAPYRGQLSRDIIFVATAGHGETLEGAVKLQEAIRTYARKWPESFPSAESQRAREEHKLKYAQQGLAIVENDAAWQKNGSFQAQFDRMDPGFRVWFREAFGTVAGDINLDVREQFLQARLAWIRAGRPSFRDGFDYLHASNEERAKADNRHPLMQAYIGAKELDNLSGAVSGASFWSAPAQLGARFDEWQYRAKLRDYLQQAVAYHQARITELTGSQQVYELFQDYDNTLTLNLELYSGGSAGAKHLATLVGLPGIGTVVEPQSTEVRQAFEAKVPQVGTDPAFRVVSWGSKDGAGNANDPCLYPGTPMESRLWWECGRLAFTIVNKEYYPARAGTPDDAFEHLTTAVLAEQLPVIGKGILSIAKGRVTLKKLEILPAGDLKWFHGTIYAKAGTDSLVPNHPMSQRTFVRALSTLGGGFRIPIASANTNLDGSQYRGMRPRPIMQANPYGQYNRRYCFDMGNYGGSVFLVDAFTFDQDGIARYAKDTSLASQAIFKNEAIQPQGLGIMGSKEIHLGMFRASEVACFQRGNPKTLNSFASFEFLSRLGLQPPERMHIEVDPNAPGIIAYLDPDCEFYIGMKDASAENPEVQTFRAFMLNVDPEKNSAADIPATETEDIFGRGYLAADTGNLAYPYFDAAESMLRTNEKRLRLQQKYHMADEQMIEAQKSARTLLAQAKTERTSGDTIQAVNDAGRSLAVSINLHPVLRTNISNAIVGILWYLWLLVPFVFFFEKLVFGFTDIRKQLVTIGVTFVAVFALLKTFHPAFKMVRSEWMILLGFLILLLAVIVMMMVSGKFSQTIKAFRSKEGNVEGADVNRGGVIGTAFMLGLNNMRRRKVRTGLTCFTLIMITFMMICFASVSTNYQDVEYRIGRAPSSGLLRRDPNFIPLTENELNNLRQIYGLKYPVSVQHWTVGKLDPLALKNAEIKVERAFTAAGEQTSKAATVSASLTVQADEPSFSGIDKYLKTTRGWFPADPATFYIILPDTVAQKLDITPEMVNAAPVPVTIRGEAFQVWGIIDALELSKHVGIDGQSMLPYDLNTIQQLIRSSDGVTMMVPQTIRRLPAAQVIITSKMPVMQGAEAQFPVACSIRFPDSPYQLRPDLPMNEKLSVKAQRENVTEYLERVGAGAYYAIDKVAYYGERTRKKSREGLLQLIIPLLIAAMTVFNTMRGSVYERKDEIYVYNAVGIAPNHVFFMFMAEACVYAVIGAMMGYLLSQITGTVLTALGVTGGLNMDYSSIETIYASLAIVAAVLISTIIPARTAATLALPSDEVSWTVPKADGDVVRFLLPFTFSTHDRVAIISYFYRWLDANGEGSSGPFYCATPELAVTEAAKADGGRELVPSIETTVWLKPYDLGVSQRVHIALPTDPETGEYIAEITIERLSGTMAAWERTGMPFLVALRKQFLNWRAVTDAERAEMFAEAKTLITNATVATATTDRETIHV